MKTLIKSQTFMQTTGEKLNTHTKAISRFEVQLGQLANSLNKRPKETLPIQSLTNPRTLTKFMWLEIHKSTSVMLFTLFALENK